MNKYITKLAAVAFLTLGISLTLAQAQGVFRSDMAEHQPGGVSMFGGVAFFSMDGSVGEFQIAVVYPFTGSFTPTIYTPAGSLTFLLGAGEPRTYSGCDPFRYNPFLPPTSELPDGYECPSLTTGTHYVGSFQSSPDIYADLLAGRGEFRLLSDSGVVLSGSMSVVPEPSTLVLLMCGATLLLRRTGRRA
jgi:hypothetical protein